MSYRTLSTRLPVSHTISKRLTGKQNPRRNMSFFPRALIGSDPATSFTPLFRLLDDFDTYSRSTNSNAHHHRSHLRSFNPRFDVKEVADGYELHGELPGVEQKDIEIEFTDSQTITIRGRTERSYTAGTPPAGALEQGKTAGAITDVSNEKHNPTVEDEDAEAKASEGTEVAAPTAASAEQQQQQKKEEDKFWVSERSVGEFARTFSFPARVDQDAVKASLNNGILSILVPKAKKHESKKIEITS